MAEKETTALVGGIQKFSTEDGPGIRTTVFLKGCPLNCLWCHNPELIKFEQQVIEMPNSCIKCGYCVDHCHKKAIYVNEEGLIKIDRELCDNCLKCTEDCYAKALQPVAREMSVADVIYEVEQDKGFYDNTEGGMTISGGEMLSHPKFSLELAKAAQARNIDVCLDTSGFDDWDFLEEIASLKNVSTVLFDMKCIDDSKHMELTGQSNRLILDNLQRLVKNPVLAAKLQMRMPLISGLNDSDKIIRETGALYKELGISKLTLLPYHNLGVSKKRHIGGNQEEFETPSDERIEKIKTYFEANCNMKVEILGKL